MVCSCDKPLTKNHANFSRIAVEVFFQKGQNFRLKDFAQFSQRVSGLCNSHKIGMAEAMILVQQFLNPHVDFYKEPLDRQQVVGVISTLLGIVGIAIASSV